MTVHKGRQNLVASRRATLETVGELCHLRMERLHFSDSGTYCVEAQNAEGVDRCYVLIRVRAGKCADCMSVSLLLHVHKACCYA